MGLRTEIKVAYEGVAEATELLRERTLELNRALFDARQFSEIVLSSDEDLHATLLELGRVHAEISEHFRVINDRATKATNRQLDEDDENWRKLYKRRTKLEEKLQAYGRAVLMAAEGGSIVS